MICTLRFTNELFVPTAGVAQVAPVGPLFEASRFPLVPYCGVELKDVLA